MLKKVSFPRFIFVFPVFLLLIFSCQQGEKQDEVASHYSTDYAVDHARYFRFVKDHHGRMQLEVRHPDTSERMLFDPLGDNKKSVALSSTFIGMLSELNLDSLIVGVSEIQYVDNKKVRANYVKKQVVEAGYDTQLNVESIIARRPSVLFHSGFSTQLPHQQQLEGIGVKCIPIYEWKEQTPLGKAEWLKVYGFLFGKYEKAARLFAEIEKKYTETTRKVADIPLSKPVMCGNVMGGEWYCPAGNSFFAQLLRDANISYKYAHTEGTGSLALSQEQILMDNREAKYWINAGTTTLSELKILNPNAVFFESFQSGEVYCYSANNNFYWEKASVRPDELLSDLVLITHPQVLKERKMFFYKRLN